VLFSNAAILVITLSNYLYTIINEKNLLFINQKSYKIDLMYLMLFTKLSFMFKAEKL